MALRGAMPQPGAPPATRDFQLTAGMNVPVTWPHPDCRRCERGPWTTAGASPPLEHRLALLAERSERFLGILGFGKGCRLALLVAIAIA